jgi:hypothetical protein
MDPSGVLIHSDSTPLGFDARPAKILLKHCHFTYALTRQPILNAGNRLIASK